MNDNSNPFENENFRPYYEEQDCMNDEVEQQEDTELSQTDKEEEKPAEKKEEKKEDEKQKDRNAGEQDGKFFVVQKGMACCDKGSTFPNFKVNSHQKHYWNDEKGNADYLAVTEDDLTFNPPATPFGTCSIKNGNPCAYSPAGKWKKTYDKVKVMGKSVVTEYSELMCTIGGKITVMKHGQQSEAGKSNVNNADSREQQTYNPIMDFEEFKEEINESDQLYYE